MTPAPSAADLFHRETQLETTVATLGAEDISGQTLGVHPHQDVGFARDITHHQCDVLSLVHIVAVADDGELAVLGRQFRLGETMNQLLHPEPVGHQLGDRDKCETVLLRESLELRPPSAGPILIEHLADHSGRIKTGEPSQIHRGLGMSNALQHATGTGPHRVHVSRTVEIGRDRRGIDGDVNRLGPVGG